MWFFPIQTSVGCHSLITISSSMVLTYASFGPTTFLHFYILCFSILHLKILGLTARVGQNSVRDLRTLILYNTTIFLLKKNEQKGFPLLSLSQKTLPDMHCIILPIGFHDIFKFVNICKKQYLFVLNWEIIAINVAF